MQTEKQKNNYGGNMKLRILMACALGLFFACTGTTTPRDAAADDRTDNTTRPIVLYYSRLGHAEMVATALKNQLGCEMVKIASKKDRGMMTLMAEQTFNLNDDQDPPAQDLAQYDPIIIVSPIYFMRLSAPGRTLISQYIPKGKRVYVYTTSGGPLAGFTGRSIKAFAEESGLVVQGVHGFQIGKKTQSDFDAEIQQYLKKNQVK
jgi:flavodoxin